MTHPCYLVYSPPKVQFENFSRPMVPLTIEYPCVSNERTNILLKKYLQEMVEQHPNVDFLVGQLRSGLVREVVLALQAPGNSGRATTTCKNRLLISGKVPNFVEEIIEGNKWQNNKIERIGKCKSILRWKMQYIKKYGTFI